MTGTAVLARSETLQPPADAGELFTRDGGFIRGMVRHKLGPQARAQDVEDATADIIEKLVARDVIGMYDPGYQSAHTGKPVPWRTFLGRQVELYGRWKREQVGRRAAREVYAPPGDDGTWVEAVTGASWDDYPLLSDSEFVQRMRGYLASAPQKWSGPVSLPALFELLVSRARAGERVTRAAVEAEFGVTPSVARASLARLRAALRAVWPAPPRKLDIAGVQLTAAQAAAAAQALDDARGNRVAPALAAIGSPLAGLGTRQYIALGKAELKAHPECAVAKGSRHSGHSSQTKVALMHMLRRLAGVTPAPPCPPAEEEAPEVPAVAEILESELWHFPGMTAEKLEYLLSLARSAFAGTG